MGITGKIRNFFENDLRASFFVFCIVFFVLAIIYINSPGISAIDDHFFHFKYAYLLRTEGWNVVKNFDWIYYTKTAQEHDPYPVSLYNLALIPFTYAKDMILGLKISDAFWASLSLSLLYYVFRKIRIKFSLFFVSLVASSYFFLSRMMLGRAFVLIVPLVFLEIYLATEKKYKKLFFVSIFHVMWHFNTFFFPIVVALIVEIARSIELKKISLKSILYSGAGSIMGLLILLNANFFKYAKFQIAALFDAQLSSTAGMKGEGTELYVKDSLTSFWTSSNIIFLLAVISIGLTIYFYVSRRNKNILEKKEEHSQKYVYMYATFIFLLILILSSMVLSGRFYDFFIPASVFLTAIVFSIMIEEKKVAMDPLVFKYLAVAVIIFFVFNITTNLVNFKTHSASVDYEKFFKAADWVKNKSENKEIIFLQNWSWFTVSFFENSKNVYTMGMEPRGLFQYSPELYWKWYNIFNHNYYCAEKKDCSEEVKSLNEKFSKADDNQKKEISKENSGKIINSIKNDFHSRFIISNSAQFNGVINLNPNLIEEKFEAKSEMGGASVTAFQLK